jgi:hypothetical protein
MSDQGGGSPKRGPDRADELRLQRAAEQKDHAGLHPQGGWRGSSQLWGESLLTAAVSTVHQCCQFLDCGLILMCSSKRKFKAAFQRFT